MMYKDKQKEVMEVIISYLEGIYFGDVIKLEKCFSDKAYLYGDIKGAEYKKSVGEYLEGVKNRQSPNEMNENNRMEIIGLDILGSIAIAKLHVPMLGYNYYDFLSLSLVNREWKIVNKLFTHVE